MEYRGKSKVLAALFQNSGGSSDEGYALTRSAGDVETWTSGSVTVYRLMIGVVCLVVKSADMSTSQTTVATIPEKFRPVHDVYVSGEAYDGSARGIGISTGGVVTAYAGSTGMYVTVTYIIPVDWNYEIVSYYQDPTVAAVRKINALSSEWESFVILTDNHGTYNKHHSQNVIRHIVENTGINAFWLGDVSHHLWGDQGQAYDGEDYHDFAEPLLPCSNKVYFALGNHERVAWDDLDYDDIKVIYNDFVASKDVTGNKSRYYYYFDDESKKIRYLVLNTSESTSDWHKMSATQLAWIDTAVTLPDSTWNLVVFGHLDIDPNTFLYDGSDDGADIVSTIKGCNGHIVGYFCGHQHLDLISDIDGKFHQVTLLCDKFDNHVYYPDYQIPSRVADTESEQAVTIVHVNTVSKRVEFTRIGAYVSGQLHSFTYT